MNKSGYKSLSFYSLNRHNIGFEVDHSLNIYFYLTEQEGMWGGDSMNTLFTAYLITLFTEFTALHGSIVAVAVTVAVTGPVQDKEK